MNLSSNDFSLGTFRLCYSIFVCSSLVMIISVLVCDQILYGVDNSTACKNFHVFVVFVLRDLFSISAAVIYILFILSIHVNFIFIAKRWKNFSTAWKKLDNEFKALFIFDMNLKRSNSYIFRRFLVLLTVTTVNFYMFFLRVFIQSTCIELQSNDSFGAKFFLRNFSEFFKVVPYHFTFGFFLLAIETLSNVAWVFNDSFIIIVSFLIARQFDTFDKKISFNLTVSFCS